jgi:hypothetical protein
MTVTYTDEDEHVLVVTDGTYSEVKFGDYSVMLTLQPAPTEADPRRCAWGLIHTGYIDANAMFVARPRRKTLIWQVTVLGLFGPGDIDVNRILNFYFRRADKAPIAPTFKAVIFHAGADYVSNLVYHTVAPGATTQKTPQNVIEDVEKKIRFACRNLAGTPPKIWAGVGFVGSNVNLRHGIDANERIRGMAWADVAGKPDAVAHRYFDRVLARVHWDLCSTRRTLGIFDYAVNPAAADAMPLPVFNPGSLALRADTTGRGYPVAGDLANAGRVMAGVVSGVLKKLNNGNRDGIGFVFYDDHPERWGYPATWGPRVRLLPAQPMVLAELPACQEMPYHLYSVPGAIVVSL